MNNEQPLVTLNLDGEAAKVFVEAKANGNTPEIIIVQREDSEVKHWEYEKKHFSKKVAITSVAEYVFKKAITEPIESNAAMIVYCIHPDRTRLDYHQDVNTALSTDLTSSLSINPDFKAFGINKPDVAFSIDDLLSLVRTHGHCFTRVDDVKDFMKGLRNFEVKFDMFVQKADDRQGNTKDIVTTAINQAGLEIPRKLALSLPLFVAGPKVTFEAELEIQRGKNNMPEFLFYNIDVEILLRNQASEIILAEVNKFKDKFVCLEVE